jgi:hypothetical protein
MLPDKSVSPAAGAGHPLHAGFGWVKKERRMGEEEEEEKNGGGEIVSVVLMLSAAAEGVEERLSDVRIFQGAGINLSGVLPYSVNCVSRQPQTESTT